MGQVEQARSQRRRKANRAPTCDDCFFRCHNLCALDLDAPCSTFRRNGPAGLVPPRQPALLLRDPGEAPALAEGLAQTA